LSVDPVALQYEHFEVAAIRKYGRLRDLKLSSTHLLYCIGAVTNVRKVVNSQLRGQQNQKGIEGLGKKPRIRD
jgi:hypothetical protein